MKQTKKISESRSTMVKVLSPVDANHYGYVHGGVIMKYVDEAAYVSATRHAHKNVVTASLDHMTFEAPAHIGDILVLKSSINNVWNTSMEVGVRVEVETKEGRQYLIGRAYATMVALDAMGKPTKVPGLTLETKEDKRRAKEALMRRKARLKGSSNPL